MSRGIVLLVALAAFVAAPNIVGAASGSSDHSQGTAGTSGDPTQPQPLSNADKNPRGANNGGNCGAYCSTRNGSPSLNGNGNGKATGKPCAGCVGKADNKNPPGQRPNGSDPNNGYECDGNHGIGRSNPAHTGCVAAATPPATPPQTPPPPPTTPPGTPPGSPPGTPAGTPPGTPPAGGGTPSTPSSATPNGPPSSAGPAGSTRGTRNGSPSSGNAGVEGHQQTAPTPAPASMTQSLPAKRSGRLPFTGDELVVMALAGLALLAAGIWLRRLGLFQDETP